MVITFLSATSQAPVGGLVAIYGFANSLSRRGHEVHLVHVNAGGGDLGGADEIAWARFEPEVRHHFPPDESPEHLPDADFVFGFGGEYPSRCGLPLFLVQGYGALAKPIEDVLMSGPFPKLCIASWLVDKCRELEVAEAQAIHVPLGLDHEKYRIVTPVAERPSQVAMAYGAHPLKGSERGLDALARVKRRLPEVEAVVFGALEPEHVIPAGVTYLSAPSQATIVERIYNRSRVFLSSSVREGLGLPGLEAMACGCAVVTTDSGGSREYAFDGETAVVAAPGTAPHLAAAVVRLLTDGAERQRLADAGERFARRFDWDRSGALVEEFLGAYRADPPAFQATAPAWREYHGRF
jgi:glycosyltransferase involved in cell wall biosynthesis